MVDAVSATQPVATTTGTSPSSTSALTSDFETFLKMLTAQARYQDPLEPIDSSEYAAQLAQFSMVEQQVQTNETLTALIGNMGSSQFSAMSDWVGMEVGAAMPAYFDGAPVTVYPNPAAISDKVELVVYDNTGAEVQRIDLPVSADSYEWDGTTASGGTVATGHYSFQVESQKDGEVILAEPAQIYAGVQEAQLQNGEVVLILDGGQAILSSSVTSIRNPVSSGGSTAG